jgi:hypothetical protein
MIKVQWWAFVKPGIKGGNFMTTWAVMNILKKDHVPWV